MKKSGSGTFNGILPGILFAVLGIVLLLISPKSAVVWSIAIADLLFGIVLVVLNFISKKNNSEQSDSFEIEQPTELEDDFDAASASEPTAMEDDFDAPIEEEEPDSNSYLIEREKELREARKQAVREAKQAQEEANAAAELSRSAEDALIEAEIAADSLEGDAQLDALMKVDDLANTALEASQTAAAKARAAQAAVDKARQAMAAHDDICSQLTAAGIVISRETNRFSR